MFKNKRCGDGRICKPPLGLTPRKIHNHKRFSDVIDAIKRYSDAGLEIPTEWISELVQLGRYL